MLFDPGFNPSYASQLLGIPFVPIREERLEHNHIGQEENGVADCPACEAIDPYHMTMQYVETERIRQIRQMWDD